MICMEVDGMKRVLFKVILPLAFIVVWLIPRNFGIAGSIGVLALDAIIGGMIGVIVLIMKIIAIIREVINIIMELAGKRIPC